MKAAQLSLLAPALSPPGIGPAALPEPCGHGALNDRDRRESAFQAFDLPSDYCRGKPGPPGAMSASVGAALVLFQKIVPVVVLAKLRLPLVWKVTGTAEAT